MIRRIVFFFLLACCSKRSSTYQAGAEADPFEVLRLEQAGDDVHDVRAERAHVAVRRFDQVFEDVDRDLEVPVFFVFSMGQRETEPTPLSSPLTPSAKRNNVHDVLAAVVAVDLLLQERAHLEQLDRTLLDVVLQVGQRRVVGVCLARLLLCSGQSRPNPIICAAVPGTH